MENIAIILAGGVGSRLQSSTPKQYLSINKKEILLLTLSQFLVNNSIDGIKVVIHPEHLQLYNKTVAKINSAKLMPPAYGDISRQASVLKGLDSIKHLNPNNVIIHDACRPFISQRILLEVIDSLSINLAVDVGIKPIDTIKRNINGQIISIDREELYNTQTPQGFRYNTIYQLHNDFQSNFFTDDISLCLKANITPALVIGDNHNIKITSEIDLDYAEYIYAKLIERKIIVDFIV